MIRLKLFYNLLRGSGTKGLSAMPILKENLKGFHIRPILSFNKTALIDLVKQMNFDYINDDSNENMNFSRNYIREKILPAIKKKWPNYNKTVDRAILNLTNAQKLCSDLALIDLKKYKIQNKDNIISINVRTLMIIVFIMLLGTGSKKIILRCQVANKLIR